MHHTLFRALQQRATVITGSKHLARALTEQYTIWQRDRGGSIWRSPNIIDWGSFLHESWSERLLRGESDGFVLLNPAQEAAVWENIITASPAGRTLLRIPETAQAAMQAWTLIHAYRVPFRAADFSLSDDCQAFYNWAAEFQKLRDANRWLEPARLADVLAPDAKQPILLAGFDDPTPQQQNFLGALGAKPGPAVDPSAAQVRTSSFHDTAQEIRSAAQWARGHLETNPAAQIGILVPNLDSIRSKVERIFSEYLASAFHISLGAPLSEHPIVHAALLILECLSGPVPLEKAGMFLRSPFTRGPGDQVDAKLRREKITAVDIPAILKLNLPKFPAEQTASAWARSFSRMLRVAGWPGQQTLSSTEYQAVGSWNKLLSSFSTLDAVCGRMTFDQACHQLQRMARNSEFQPENTGAAIQIAGLLEASGLRFDRVWVMGLHDEALPPRAHPNPFIPIRLQREYGLPHCSAERELEFNGKLMSRLMASAPDVVLSYPEWEGDQPLGASPLLPPRTTELAIPKFTTWTALIHSSGRHDSLHDATAPALRTGAQIGGGTSILRDMAACPFKAYATYRLGARGMEEPRPGLDARDKGTAVHEALRILWAEIKTHENLLNLNETEKQRIVSASVEQALAGFQGLGASLERLRLTRLVAAWLEIERARPPFTVLDKEEKRPAVIGGLQLTTRIDRIDELPDGRRVIIDYKTGDVKTGVWSGDRLDEPQVPLYCVANRERVSGAAFAQIRTGAIKLQGVGDNGEFGQMTGMRLERGLRMSELIDEWERALDKLAAGFRAGLAAVDPKHHSSCNFCDLAALCRIHDDPD